MKRSSHTLFEALSLIAHPLSPTMSPFGRAPALEPELFSAGALPKGLAKRLLAGIRREMRSLEHLGRGELQKPAPLQLHRLLPAGC
jgi:hypothetical protein